MPAASNGTDIGYWNSEPARIFTRDDLISRVVVATAKEHGVQSDTGGPDDTLAQVLLQTPSRFDIGLVETWKRASDGGALNYTVDNVLSKILPGKYGIVLQLNPSRRSHRRTPSKFTKLIHPFDASGFNFTKIKINELLFNLVMPAGDGTSIRGSLIVNSAPLCQSHCLLLTSPGDCAPQALDDTSLQFGVTSVLLSGVRSYRVGFNSLCAFASVNHNHFHVFHLDHPLNVETAVCRQLRGPCYAFVDHFAPGFVFQVTADDVQQSVRSAMKLINHLTTTGIPHNVFITRGLPVVPDDNNSVNSSTVPGNLSANGMTPTLDGDQRPTAHITTAAADTRRSSVDTNSSQIFDVVRICVWARQSSVENYSDQAEFYTAVCELSGLVPVYSSDVWENIKEEPITKASFQVCSSSFNALLPTVEQLYV